MTNAITPDNWPTVSALLDEALALPAAKRDTWLQSLDGERAALRDMLHELLSRASGVETEDFLATLPRFTRVTERGPLTELAAGDAIGPYKLISELGTGGMGAVWLAERSDGQLKRKVALKLPRMVWAKGLAERMGRERDILASLEHPNIARLYDAGVDQHGRPYLALEYVEGQPIDVYAKERGLSVRQKLDLLLQVCAAVAFAHSRLVVHRDLKPSNIMITADGQVRLLDFGIAKLMEGDSTKETQLTQLAGRALTLDYASPEQIKGEPIGTASDVYSLGVVAYELLTGAKPYRLKRGSAAELEEAIATADPPRASEAANEPKNKTALRGDLDAIVAKTLKKMPQERYGTVESLSRDFNAYLSGSAVAARPDSLRYRASKFASRNRRVLLASGAVTIARAVSIGIGATALITLSLAVGLVVSIWQAQIARREKDLALAMSDRNEAASGFIDTLLTQVARSGKPMTATDLIDRAESLLQEEFRQSPDSHGQVLSVLSTSAHTLGQPGRALELIERAIQVTRGTTDHALRNRLELERAIALGWTGRSQEAQTAIEAVLSQGGLRPDESHEGQSYLAHLAYQRGDHPLKQLHHASEALRLLGQVRRPSPKLRASALADLALALFENGKVDEADRMYADVIRLHSTLNGGRSPSALIAMNNWGVMLDSAGDLPAARDIYDRGLSIASEDTPGQPPPLSLFISHARVLHQMGRLDEAEARLRDAIQQAEMQGAILAAKYTRSNLALLCLDRNDLASARRYLQEYDDEARIDLPLQGRYGRARRLADGRLAMAEGRVADAAEALSPLTVDAPRYAITVTALLLRADVWLLQSEPARAEADANRALDIARSLQSRHRPSCRVGLALLTLAKIASYRGDLAQAREKSRLSLAQLEKTLDPSHPARLDAQGRCAATEN